MKYNKEQKNPNNGEWVSSGHVMISDDDADLLNANSHVTGIRYKKATKPKAKKQVKEK